MLIWHDEAWKEYLQWLELDKKKFNKVNALLKEVMKTSFEGTGKPEPLKGNLEGLWSRRIDQEHRLIYRVDSDNIVPAQCRGHY